LQTSFFSLPQALTAVKERDVLESHHNTNRKPRLPTAAQLKASGSAQKAKCIDPTAVTLPGSLTAVRTQSSAQFVPNEVSAYNDFNN
jgi:hypothetical protein